MNGKPITNVDDWSRFSNRAEATTWFNQDVAAVTALPGAQVILSQMIDNIEAGGEPFVLNAPLDPNNPQPGDVTCWVSWILFTVNGVEFSLEDYCGSLILRNVKANMADGDTNYKQVGHGGNTRNVTVPGKVAIQLLPAEGLAQSYLVAA